MSDIDDNDNGCNLLNEYASMFCGHGTESTMC